MGKCYFCAAEFNEKIYKTTLCPSCCKELKICMNCLHYDSLAYHECREPQAELVKDKLKANFCEYFTPGGNRGKPSSDGKENIAKKKFEDLFS